MSKNVYEAVRAKLRAEGQKSIATIELLLTQPTAFPNNTNIVEEIARLALHLVQSEGALLTFEQYFSPLYAPPRAPGPPSPQAELPKTPPKIVTPEMSPTYKQSIAVQEAKKKRKQRKKSDD